MSEELALCPFCGGKPRVDLDKITYCQLHGEPSQTVRVYCYRSDCAAKPSVSAGDVYNGGEAAARRVAIAAWNRRAPSPDMREAVEALEFYAAPASWTNDEQVNRDEMFDTPVQADNYGDRARAAIRSLTGAKP